MPFRDRTHAGRELGLRLVEWADSGDLLNVLVLALPRGGVPVAVEVARALHAPLDVLVAGEISTPIRPQTPIGALVADDPPLYDRQSLAMMHLSEDRLGDVVVRERNELHRLEYLYRGRRPPPSIDARIAIPTRVRSSRTYAPPATTSARGLLNICCMNCSGEFRH